MKKHLPWIVTACAAAITATFVFKPEPREGRDLHAFGQLPVLVGGRIKPLDTVARNSLLVMHDKQTLRQDGQPALSAMAWLAEVFFDPAAANTRKLFTIHDPQVLSLFGWQQNAGEKYFSFDDLRPHLAEIDHQTQLANPVPAETRSMFQRHIESLYQSLVLYQRLKNSLQLEDSPDFAREISIYQAAIAPGVAAMNARDVKKEFNQQEFDTFLEFASRYKDMAESAYMLVIPPVSPTATDRSSWDNIGTSLGKSVRNATIHPVVKAYGEIGSAYRANNTEAFNTAVKNLTSWFGRDYAPELKKAREESFFNHYEPFYKAMIIYVLVMVLAFISWLTGPGVVRQTAFWLMGLAFAIHTSGILFRMFLEGRPPVTNLYSSALFVGWFAVLLGIILERIYKNGIGSVVSGAFGFTTLIVAHHLGNTGDTLEMMRAVLDSNFWLSTHVVTVTIGYSATFLAGFLGLVYILMGSLSKWLDQQFEDSSATAGNIPPQKPVAETNARALTRMVYGIVCFATLFSFVGTVLGGIWADQSWGRFWGWDPKENGAALIVLWNAMVLHMRWGGYVREKGLMVLAVGGNIITSWSWFGVNMLGVGLHSYGFMDSAFNWLVGFVAFNVVMMILGGFIKRPYETAAATAAPKTPDSPATKKSPAH